MDVYSTELGIWLSFVKMSEFRGGLNPQIPSPIGTPLILKGVHCAGSYYRGMSQCMVQKHEVHNFSVCH
jgi:hypothetical protein